MGILRSLKASFSFPATNSLYPISDRLNLHSQALKLKIKYFDIALSIPYNLT